ncbi:glutathione peroxidase [Bradyrhizobium prioriisuperbiae]|uniref:glutathione peroxidase n=1 Tax=Bradyrhizobium prioriisuperbiae TaxID=2854389 RepID=UPI0028EFA422|nr:glutathione peroxidase [Bradyrhizobium prioritasuperba]
MPSVYEFTANALTGEELPLAKFQGQVLLIVNTASKCGFTPQYEGLEALHRAHAEQGFSVLGFPCNQFGQQEPGSADEIAGFCTTKYHVTFPMFAKIDVNGAQAHPLYEHLKKARPGLMGSTAVKWNFTKFLVDRHGAVVARHAPTTAPQALVSDIETLLKQPAD